MNEELTFDELTDGEKHVQQIIRQVHGEAIVGEKFTNQSGSVTAQINFGANQPKFQTIEINLTSLAGKQKEEGLTDAVLRVVLQMQPS